MNSDTKKKIFLTKPIQNAMNICSLIPNFISKSVDEIEPNLEELNHLCDNDEVCNRLFNCNYHLEVLDFLKNDDPKIKIKTFSILLKIIRFTSGNNESFLLSVTLSVCEILNNVTDVLTHESCLNFLIDICNDSFNGMLSIENKIKLIDTITKAINWRSQNIIFDSLQLLYNLNDSQNAITKFLLDKLDDLIKELRNLSGARYEKLGIIICKLLLKVIENIDKEEFESISESNIADVLIKLLFHSHTMISENYYFFIIKLFCKILFFSVEKETSILTISKENYTYIIIHRYHSDIVTFLLENLKKYNMKEILICGFKILYLFVSLSKSLKRLLNESDQESWIQFILDVLKNNLQCSETINWSFSVINRIIVLDPNLVRLIENKEFLQDTSLDTLLLQIFYSQTELSISTLCSCFEITSILSKYSEKIQNHFLESQIQTLIHLMVVRCLQTKSLSKEIECQIRLAATNAMKSLILYNLPAKELFYNEQTQYEDAKRFLVSCCQHNHDDCKYEECLAATLLFLACLVEYNSIKYDLMQTLQSTLMKLLSCERCSMSPTIIEAFQELLIVLSGFEHETLFILDILSIRECCELASKFLNFYAIQKNTVIFIQLNSSSINKVEKLKILQIIGETIFRATSLFKNCLIIRAEACVLIQILLKQYPEFSPICVENNLDKFLFETINMNQNPDLIKIGLQAFYVLTELQENRDLILIKAIKESKLKLVQCLIAIGSDLAKVSKDALLSAVKQKDEAISFQLMSHLVNNGCKPEFYLITCCFDTNNYKNAIVLLRHYGINDSTEGKIINWSDLGMRHFHISWLEDLCEKQKLQIDPNVIWLSKRIKQESKNRMLLRQNYEKYQNSHVKSYRYPETQMRTLDKDIAGHKNYTRINNGIPIRISNIGKQNLFYNSSLHENSHNLINYPGNYSLRYPEKLQQNIVKEDAKSEEFCVTSKTIIKQKSNMRGYLPVKGEISEFLTAFRCGTDFSYHPLDPRCLQEKQNKNLDYLSERESGVVFDFHESPLQFSIKSPKDYKNDENTSISSVLLETSIENQIQRNKVGYLNLSKNKLSNLEDFIEFKMQLASDSLFKHLTTLKLEKNSIKSIPESAFQNMEQLKILDLSENRLTKVPWFVFKYSPLENLNLSKNNIKQFCLSKTDKTTLKSFRKTNFLSIINLSNNKFTDFDINSFDVFQQLQSIKINEIGLNISEKSMHFLRQLKKISLKGNSIADINEKFLENCDKIDSVNLSENKLVSIDNTMSINLALFDNLTDVNLSKNNLACGKPYYIPKCILKIPKLQTIDMSYNNIIVFPPCTMWTSKCLMEINFSHNLIKDLDLPHAKTSFQNLNNLNLSFNCLKRISPEIGNLSSLTLLDISHNPNLKSLPDEIGLLKGKNLNSLVRDGLNLNIPKHISKNAQLREILKYYYDRLKHSVEYNGLRLVVLGLKGRGKTSVLNLLQGSKLKPKNNNKSSEIEVSIWKVQSKLSEKAVDYKLTCWDISGQDEFFCNHECFLSQRAFYLLVFDITKETEEIHKLKPLLWNLKCQAPHAPVFIVGTHLDKMKENNRKTQCRHMESNILKLCSTPGFPKISKIVFVDATNFNQTITNLKNKILTVLNDHTIQNDHLLFEKQPSSYLKLEELFQEALKTLPENCPILTEKEVKDLVVKHKLDLNDEELKLAVQFLHNCGVIVHFNDTMENLNNLYFLKPQWICSIIIKTITMNRLNTFIQNGSISLNDFLSLFKDHFFSKETENFKKETLVKQCLKVLELYDVVFRNSNNEIIIPSKLPIQAPTNLSENLNTSKISRIFAFSFLPTGFWPRLIARISVLAKSFKHLFDICKLEFKLWRTGVIISMEDSIYLILEGKKDTEKNLEIIEISVTKSELGIKILVQIVDCIDVLVEEWYAGLTDDDLHGNRIMNCYVRCLECAEQVPLLDIASISLRSDHFFCTSKHQNQFRIVVPDIVLGDLPDDILINPSDLEVNTSKDNMFGVGGNGSVFKGYYKGKCCAVKYINVVEHSNDAPSYRLLRQEIDILRRFQHPSIVSLLAVDRKRIVLEFAPFKDLKCVFQHYINLSSVLLQRIAYQVISGIQFLHFNNIIYRDIKMQNVLVFSLELSSKINVKLADYGISRELAPFGFVIPQGTPGYQAPEVLERCISYKLPADIFSFGILLFNIGTMGHHPAEFRAHWRAGKQIDLISEHSSNSWPRMQDCIHKCTKLVPEDRPNAEDISKFILCPSFVAIKYVWPLTRQTRIECMTTMMNESNILNVFLANGNKFKQEVRSIDIKSGQSKGKSFCKEVDSNRILSMMVFESIIFLGTQNGQLWTYDHLENKFENTNLVLPDAILCMVMKSYVDYFKVLMMGLANGTIYYKLGYTSIQDINSEILSKLPLSDAPVTNIFLIDDYIFATSGFVIYKINLSIDTERFTAVKLIEIDSSDQDRLIKCFCPFTENTNGDLIISFYFTIRNESLIYNFDDQGIQLKPAVDCKELIKEKLNINSKSYSCRIMCMTIWSGDRYLCAGTGNGYLIIIDQEINYTVVLSLFKNHIICIQHSKLHNKHDKPDKEIVSGPTPEKPDVTDHLINCTETFESSAENTGLIIVGNGYKSIEEDFDGAVLIVLSDDISNISRQLEEHINSRNHILMGFDRGNNRGGSFNRGGNRGAPRGGGNRGGRGGYGRKMEDEGPPDVVEEIGHYSHVYEDGLICKITHERIPYFNAPVYLENKEVVGKVDEVFGQLADPHFHLKLLDTFKATSFKENSKFYMSPYKMLTKDRLVPTPRTPGAGASRGGRGGDRGRGGARGGGRGGDRGGRGGFNRGAPRGRGGFQNDRKRSFGGDSSNAKRIKFD